MICSRPSLLIGPSPLVTKTIFRLYFSFLVYVLIIWIAKMMDEIAISESDLLDYEYIRNILTVSCVRIAGFDLVT